MLRTVCHRVRFHGRTEGVRVQVRLGCCSRLSRVMVLPARNALVDTVVQERLDNIPDRARKRIGYRDVLHVLRARLHIAAIDGTSMTFSSSFFRMDMRHAELADVLHAVSRDGAKDTTRRRIATKSRRQDD